MKKLIVLTICALGALSVCGCQQEVGIETGGEVAGSGNERFPEFLVGTWTAGKGDWEFIFEADGTISSALISLGRVRVKPGEVSEIDAPAGQVNMFEAGEFTVDYDSGSRELKVVANIDSFYMGSGDKYIDGDCRDVFVGKVSEDGSKWFTQWTTFPNYVVHSPDQEPIEFAKRLPKEGVKGVIVFHKRGEK